jgi:hypothetical protein
MVATVTPSVTTMCQSWKLLQLCTNPGSCYTTAATGAIDSADTRLLKQMPPILEAATPTVICFNLQD